ncbi:MAG: DUF1080 domain-containing protein [Planctomycetota bacterium]|nr:DUF1080 domain-containing protein [Planctomycetota bacterium]
MKRLPPMPLLSSALLMASLGCHTTWMPGEDCCEDGAGACCVQANEHTADEALAGGLEPGWIALFNGRDLTGWVPKFAGSELGVNFRDTFRVEDGLLVADYSGYEDFDGQFGHLFFESPFDHYRMRVEYRFVGEQVPGGPGWAWRNSGVMVHGQDPASMTVDQSFPVSVEVQMLGGPAEAGGGERSTANLCTPGTHVTMLGEVERRHCIDSSSQTYRGDRWCLLEIEVLGNDVIRHFMDGQLVLEYSLPVLDRGDADAKRLLDAGAPRDLDQGWISLQAESHPVQFRRVELMPM